MEQEKRSKVNPTQSMRDAMKKATKMCIRDSYIAKEFVRDNIDVDILEDLLSLGGLGIQYCIKSEAAYSNLKEITAELLAVDYTEFNDRYNQRDITARKRMRELVDSDANTVTKVFSTLFER